MSYCPTFSNKSKCARNSDLTFIYKQPTAITLQVFIDALHLVMRGMSELTRSMPGWGGRVVDYTTTIKELIFRHDHLKSNEVPSGRGRWSCQQPS